MSGFLISFILRPDVIAVMFLIVHQLDFLKSLPALLLYNAVKRRLHISPVTVPVNILPFPFSVNMLAVFKIKFSVIMLWVIDSVFAGSPVMSCQFHCQSPPLPIFLFLIQLHFFCFPLPAGYDSSRPASAPEISKTGFRVTNAPDNTQYDLTRASDHWARRFTLDPIMGVAP